MKVVKGKFADHSKAAEPVTKKQKDNEISAYSAMLMNLVKPYLDPVPSEEGLEDMLRLGIVAWNMAISEWMGVPGFRELFAITMKTAGISKSDELIVKEIMKKKQDTYPGHDKLIEDFEIYEDNNGETRLSVISKSFADYMHELQTEEEELEDMQYEEGFVNRNALLVKPKAAYWNWFEQFDKDIDKSALPDESTIYLISEQYSDADILKWLKKNFDRIFLQELNSWLMDEACWPKKRTYKMFTDFFEVTYHSMVMDMENEPVIKD